MRTGECTSCFSSLRAKITMYTALAGPCKSLNFFFQIFRAWKVLENRHGLWKSLNLYLYLKVLESAGVWFSKTSWPNQLILKTVFQMASFWPQICIESIFSQGFGPDPAGGAYDAIMLIKVPAWFILVLLIYPSYGSWKSLNLILTNGQEPCKYLFTKVVKL